MERKIKVVVADDMEIIVRNMKSVIEENPNVEKIECVFNGEDEINAILNLKPDIVFTDMQMPKKTGLEVIEEVMTNTSIEKKPQFILVTADRDSSLVIKSRELGFYIEYKPINASRINEYINNFTDLEKEDEEKPKEFETKRKEPKREIFLIKFFKSLR